MLCPSCHTENRENAKFCKNCGFSLAAQNKVVAVSTPTSEESQAAIDNSGTSVATTQTSAPTQTNVAAQEDISLEPTLLLHKEENNPIQPAANSNLHANGDQDTFDIADAPTVLFNSSGNSAAAASSYNQIEDIADMPTVIVPPADAPTATSTPIPPPPPPESLTPATDGTMPSVHTADATNVADTSSSDTPEAASPKESDETIVQG